MAEIKLSPSQQAIVDYRGGAMLVSAAAGSGKTMVLVQRLMARLCEQSDPKNIDDFLMITYTKKAAAELRAKIIAEISRRVAGQPENAHLRRQLHRIYSARISTVHAFCADVLRGYSNVLDLSPDFRIAEESACAIFRENAAAQTLDEAYAALDENPDYRAAIDLFGAGRDDRALPKLVIATYDNVQCSANPQKQIQRYRQLMEFDPAAEASQTVWGAYLCDGVRRFAADETVLFSELLQEFESAPAYAASYGPSVQTTRDDLAGLARCQSWDAVRLYQQVQFDRLKPVKKDQVEPALKEMTANIRKQCQAGLKKWRTPFYGSSAEMLAELQATAAAVRGLLAMTERFGQLYQAEKKRRNSLDFGDLEHLALQLFYGKKQEAPTAAAKELSDSFTEVLVDEYQDTNAVQDLIFHAVSHSGANLFMVGDVKQSIYRFRLADPTIFLEKYHSFSDFQPGMTGPARFFLSENFRSQKAILDAANQVFTGVMTARLGGLAYTEHEMLREGCPHPSRGSPCVELDCIDYDSGADDEESPDRARIEAGFLAKRIKTMLASAETVSKDDQTRPVTEKDIVILLRKMSNAGIFQQVLEEAGISCVCDRSDNILDTTEISVLISFLQIIDNPYQDVPLLAVLNSPAGGFTPDELAAVRVLDRSAALYDALLASKTEKAEQFCRRLELFRRQARELHLGELVNRLIQTQELTECFSAMRRGEQRAKNLQLFSEYAQRAEAATPELAGFLRALEQLRASGRGIQNDAEQAQSSVTITTIHKSKGLEYPVVFLAELSGKFNQEDLRQAVLFDTEMGVGARAMDETLRVSYSTIARSAIASKIEQENRSEELRVLYVAMTRAKDLLIMTYCSKHLKTELAAISSVLTWPVRPQMAENVTSAGKWVLMAALCRQEAGALHDLCGRPACVRAFEGAQWKICYDGGTEGSQRSAALPQQIVARRVPTAAEIAAAAAYLYPYRAQTQTPAKITPTQLKGRVKDYEAADDAARLLPLRVQVRQPEFAAEKTLRGAQLGDAVHLAMRFLNDAACETLEGVQAELERLCAAHHLTREQARAIDPAQLLQFFRSPLAARARAAHCLREYKFSVLVDAAQLSAGAGSVLLQGVVDCCMEEPDGLVILDFKSDRLGQLPAEQYAMRYAAQLQAYALAMQAVFNKPVKQCWLYFLRTGQSVELPVSAKD
ncbi:MAG: helicase-exonuclease AddAB subunit AddA [Oscillospiraceae bacterium]|nr:helicase-exonuclease AddAB subunit AddA [Oscillospiraceae bacterium]